MTPSRWKSFAAALAHPAIFFFSLIWLMVLVVVGTVAQKYMGLYQAQHLFFSALFFHAGPVPLPSGLFTMAVMTVNLLAKLAFQSPWRLDRLGTLIAHLGAILLLAGGLLTHLFGSEGSMLIYEGESLDYVTDYHERELVVKEAAGHGEEGRLVAAYPWNALKPRRILEIAGVPATIEVLKRCRNCDISPREGAEGALAAELRGRAKDFDIKPVPLEQEDEENKTGVLFRVAGEGAEPGVYLSLDYIPAAPRITAGGRDYDVALRKRRTYLPFEIKLIDFKKEFHPGTETPRLFQSEIIVIEGDSQWRSLIEMNKPLRYQGYTFYQSSYVAGGAKEATVLAVVKNVGRLFPYIASIVMCIGLLLHLVLQLPKLIRGSKS